MRARCLSTTLYRRAPDSSSGVDSRMPLLIDSPSVELSIPPPRESVLDPAFICKAQIGQRTTRLLCRYHEAAPRPVQAGVRTASHVTGWWWCARPDAKQLLRARVSRRRRVATQAPAQRWAPAPDADAFCARLRAGAWTQQECTNTNAYRRAHRAARARAAHGHSGATPQCRFVHAARRMDSLWPRGGGGTIG